MSVIPDRSRESSKVFKAGVNPLTGLDLSPGLIMIKHMATVIEVSAFLKWIATGIEHELFFNPKSPIITGKLQITPLCPVIFVEHSKF